MSRIRRLAGFSYVGRFQYFLTFCADQRARVFEDGELAASTIVAGGISRPCATPRRRGDRGRSLHRSESRARGPCRTRQPIPIQRLGSVDDERASPDNRIVGVGGGVRKEGGSKRTRPTETLRMPDRTYKESFKVAANDLVDAVKKIVHAGNVRRIIIKQEGRTVAEFPLTVGVIGTVLAPMLAALGALAAVLTECSIEVERVDDGGDSKAGAA